MKKFPISKTVAQFAHYFTQQNHAIYIVGGGVRDWILHREITDYDFATSATPQEVTALFHKVIPTGIDHGTVTVLFKNEMFEVTTFRTDDEYLDNRRPKSVSYVASIEEDLKRRDFTMNALAVNIENGELLDLHHGLDDIGQKTIRAIGDPFFRFTEDALRMVRACRFASTLNFIIEPTTAQAMKELHHTITSISGERIHIELFKILTADKPSIAFLAMDESAILPLLFPELAMCKGVTQKGNHIHDVFYHSIYACDAAPKDDVLIRLAALLHDVGKAVTKKVDNDGNVSFHHHEVESVRLAKTLMLRIKCSNSQMSKVIHLIKHHMFHYTSDFTDAAIRRFISRVGVEHIDDLFLLRRADQLGTNNMQHIEGLVECKTRIEKEIVSKHALTIKDLTVNGNDLIAIGIPKGPTIGIILKELFETVLDDPLCNNKEMLLDIGKKFYDRRINIV